MSRKNVFNLIVEALHNPNIGVEYQQKSHAYKIHRQYVNKSSSFFFPISIKYTTIFVKPIEKLLK